MSEFEVVYPERERIDFSDWILKDKVVLMHHEILLLASSPGDLP